MEVAPVSSPDLHAAGSAPLRARISRACRVRKRCVCCNCCLIFLFIVSVIAMVWGLSPTLQCNVASFDRPLADACQAANILQRHWYNKLVGGWGDTEFWGSACALQAFVDFMQISGSRDFAAAVAHVHELRPAEVILLRAAGSSDDALWWAGAYLSAYETLGDKAYLESAKKIFDTTFSDAWDTSICRGGMWWSSAKSYKNAITTSLALWVSANLFLRTGAQDYLDKAQTIWIWFWESGMINGRFLVNDGLTKNCENNYETTWTYNQGVLIGGLVALSNATGNITVLEDACHIADATLRNLVTDQGILQEEFLGNRDNVMFKGIFAKHLSALTNSKIPAEKRKTYVDFLSKNVDALLKNDKTSKGFFGGLWQGPVAESCNDVTLTQSVDDDDIWSHKAMQAKESWPALLVGGFHASCIGASAQISALHLLNADSSMVAPTLEGRLHHMFGWMYNWLRAS